MAAPPVAILVLAIVRLLEAKLPKPPGRPSNIILLPPLKLRVAVVLALVIDRLIAPLAGRTVIELEPLLPGIVEAVIGKDSARLGKVAAYCQQISRAECVDLDR